MPTNINNVFKKRYLYSVRDANGEYDFSFEQQLSDLEGLLTPLWGHLADDFFDFNNATFRKGIALFVSILHLRNPKQKLEVENIRKQIIEMFDPLPKDALGRPIVGGIEHDGKIHDFDTSDWEKFRNYDPKNLFIRNIKQHAIYGAEIFLKKRWSIIYSETPAFVTSDTPVAIVHPSRAKFGIGTPGVRISLPLSPTRILVMDDLLSEPHGRYYPLSKDGPGPLNLTVINQAERFVASSRHPDIFCAEICTWADSCDLSTA